MIKLNSPVIHTLIHIIFDVILFLIIYLVNLFPSVEISSIIIVIIASNLIDTDHLLSRPIFKEGRCSINFHLFHRWYFIIIWIVGLFISYPLVKIFCLGVLAHLLADRIDCHAMKKEKPTRNKE